MDPGDRSDEELMVDYQRGEESAFNELYCRYEKRVYGYLTRRCASPEFVDDAFQETFQRLHKHLHRYDPQHPFAPWLFTICRNALLDCLRKRKRVTQREQAGETLPEKAVPSEPSAPPLPEMGGLPENQRVALEMRYLKENTFEEIAEALGTSPVNVRQLVSRALKRLRKPI